MCVNIVIEYTCNICFHALNIQLVIVCVYVCERAFFFFFFFLESGGYATKKKKKKKSLDAIPFMPYHGRGHRDVRVCMCPRVFVRVRVCVCVCVSPSAGSW